ncbi:replication protein [Psychrobacillus sp. FSL K6-2365]|uniref:replication protein n=1 Tax=Psychrobacillus sp. FSL K6-2365 TaxID=2921546 RepID=UPI0030FB64F2
MAGWISLHRKMIDNPIYSNAFMLKLWIHCLLKATHTEHNQLVGNQMIKLEPGQFVTGRNALYEEFNKGAKKDEMISAITLWRWLKNFEEWEMLNIKTTTKYSVVTVVNWSEHQGHEQQVNNKRTADEQQMNSKRTTDEQQVNTNNNVNNVNNDNKDNNIKPSRQKRVFDKDSDEMKLVEFFIQEIRKNSSDFKDPNLQNWCDEFRKIIDLDKRDKGEVSKLIRWVQSDDFEKANVLSPSKLRKRYDALKIKMLIPPKQKQSREKVPDWFGKKDETQPAPVKEDPNIADMREKLLKDLGRLNKND